MTRKQILVVLIIQEIALILLSFLWIIITNISLIYSGGIYSLKNIEPFKNIIISSNYFLYGILAGIILLTLGSVVSLLYEPLKNTLKAIDELILSKIKPIDYLPIAILSGVGEELFFRGILQDRIGIIITSIIFAVLHIPKKEQWIYSVWALFASLYLCNLYAYTNNLFIVIVAHVINNLLALILWKSFKKRIIK